MRTIFKLPEEPPRGTTVRIVSTNDWNGRKYQRRATDDEKGRDAWFGVGNKGAGTWFFLLHRAGPDGHLETVETEPESPVVESVEEWNKKIPAIRDEERAADARAESA